MANSKSGKPKLFSNVTAVVFSGGSSTNFTPLVGDVPKPLLTVCGKTLAHHALRNLALAGFRDIIFLTNNSTSGVITDELDLALKALAKDPGCPKELPNVLVHGVPCTDDVPIGTTDSLGFLQELVDNDFVIVPCDLYGYFDFASLLKEHLSEKRLCTVAFLSRKPEDEAKSKPKRDVCLGGNEPEDWSFKYRVVATLDESTGALLSMSHLLSLESGDRFQLYKWHLARHPNCVIDRDLVDIHVYAFSNSVFKLLKSDFLTNSSIRVTPGHAQLDLVPYIARMQETPPHSGRRRRRAASTNADESDNSNEDVPSWRLDDLDIEDLEGNTGTFYFVATPEQAKCVRVNSIDAFYQAMMEQCAANRDKTAAKNSKVKNAFLGLDATLHETAVVKNSVIGGRGARAGNNVTVGSNARITDAVLMDNCVVKDNAVIEKTVLGTDAVVEQAAKLKNAVVRAGHVVPPNSCVERDFAPNFMDS